ncbi:carbohydrate ABC transporter permease [Paenibacillaceae bacterium WGS1546]|uniref:carbohydrate ABC transporter permease n=1 Tax=Cohnella sp. WGS1546 TaxID=3366810 RepID=UPI00372D6668
MTAKHKSWFIFIGLLPATALFLLFVITPIFWSTYYGFFNWSGIGSAKLIGFDNYIEIGQSSTFWKALKNNLIVVAASVLGQVPLALLIALLLTRSSFFHRFVRAAVFLPMVLSSVVIGMIWQYIYHPQIGILNFAMERLGLDSLKAQWLGDPAIAIYSLIPPLIWNYVGLYLLLFMAALSNIPSEVNDAAKIDGAAGWVKLGKVTLPMIWGTVQTAVVLCIAGSLKVFDMIFIMTGGGPAHATEVLATYMYNNTFSIYRYGYGSAVSTVMILISFTIIVVSQLIMRRDNSVS